MMIYNKSSVTNKNGIVLIVEVALCLSNNVTIASTSNVSYEFDTHIII